MNDCNARSGWVTISRLKRARPGSAAVVTKHWVTTSAGYQQWQIKKKDKKASGADKGAGARRKGAGAAEQAQRQEGRGAQQAAAPEPKLMLHPKRRFRAVAAALRSGNHAGVDARVKIDNRMRAPRLSKIVINLALGDARENVKVLDGATEELRLIAGQKPVITKARRAISNFKLREGMPIGTMVTLRRERMYEFVDRLVNVALPACATSAAMSDKPSTDAELLARHPRAYDFSRAQSRQGRHGQGDDDFNNHHRAHRQRGLYAAARDGHAISRCRRRTRHGPDGGLKGAGR